MVFCVLLPIRDVQHRPVYIVYAVPRETLVPQRDSFLFFVGYAERNQQPKIDVHFFLGSRVFWPRMDRPTF